VDSSPPTLPRPSEDEAYALSWVVDVGDIGSPLRVWIVWLLLAGPRRASVASTPGTPAPTPADDARSPNTVQARARSKARVKTERLSNAEAMNTLVVNMPAVVQLHLPTATSKH
jgi:hypothetical protein